jgi:heme oxygenase
MLDQDLKEKTRVEHAALEKTLLQIIRGVNSKFEYADLLTKLYGYYHALENVIAPFLVDSEVTDYSTRRKSGQLLLDLAHIRDGENIELCRQLPAVDSYHSALGVLYVLEGSTLGGRIIAGILSSRIQAESGFRFFHSYGEDTIEMWDRFKAHLRKPYTKDQQEKIISSAVLTFTTFKNWLGSDD